MKRAFLSLVLVWVSVACLADNEPRISVFSDFIRMTAKERGLSYAEAADLFYDLGVRGFDCGVDEKDLDELCMTKLQPINFYYFLDGVGTSSPDPYLEKAKRFGVPRIMIIPPNFTDGKENEAEFEKMVARVRSFVAEAARLGITVTVEDFGGRENPCSHAKYLKRFLDEIPELGFALDSGNLLYAGRGDDILEMMAFARGRIAHVHLKDQPARAPRSYVTLGLGAVPNEQIVKTVAASGYDGWYTLENPVGDTYLDTVRQVAVLKTWLREAETCETKGLKP